MATLRHYPTMFVLIGVNVKVMPPALFLVSIYPESVLNLRTRKTDWVSRCLLHLCHVRFVMSVVLFSVRVATPESCMW